ncbi:MAG: DUF1295 domain-containing protein [Firmicutes bacterium]|nr:DUF1295 domain-containing protein [Bacillota bacterium]
MRFVKNRSGVFGLVFVVYVLAFLGFYLFQRLTNGGSLLLSTFWGDVAATVIIWLFGIVYKNSSLYDPYWSVAPLYVVCFWLLVRGSSPSTPDILFLFALFVWGIRLTFNWATRWQGIEHQDWRYTYFKKRSGNWWQLVNLGGIHLIPTIVVYLGIAPVFFALFEPGPGTGVLLALGFVLCIIAAAIQLIADKQMDRFKQRAQSREQYIDEGIWRYSRHPNYFGELLFWWGLWVMQVGVNTSIWWTVIGPAAMTLLFVFISIPLMERHILANKPHYAEYQNTVSVLVPWMRKLRRETAV